MEKVTINGKEYSIDIEKCKEQGLLIEEKKYPNDWIELSEFERHCRNWFDVGISFQSRLKCVDKDEELAFIALGKLIQLRDWWWDNMCDRWRPNWTDNTPKYVFYIVNGNLSSTWLKTQYVLAFPSAKIGDKFYDTYKDLIEEAKMFL